MIDTVTSFLFRGDGDAVHECRRCGTTVDTVRTDCPACGSSDIVTHSTQ